MTSVRASACIVGGGPGGLVLGLLLAKRGADVLVLEGHEDFEREFRGEVLQPSTATLNGSVPVRRSIRRLINSSWGRLRRKNVLGACARAPCLRASLCNRLP